jgi:hypothetical protein
MTIRAPEVHFEPRLLDVRLVVHTHWDREWYRPFQQFRARLVALIDEVLDGSAGAPFLSMARRWCSRTISRSGLSGHPTSRRRCGKG